MRLGLSPIFITDHDTIAGAVHLNSAGQSRVVIGQEIITTEGELIGLFLERAIETGLSPRQAISEIKMQGGLTYLEHPYDQFRRHLSEKAIDDIQDAIDIVEIYNGRSNTRANSRAEELCEILGAAAGAGSDAHSAAELGSVFIEMEDFDNAQDFLLKLRRGRISKGRSKLLLLVETSLRRKIWRS